MAPAAKQKKKSARRPRPRDGDDANAPPPASPFVAEPNKPLALLRS